MSSRRRTLPAEEVSGPPIDDELLQLRYERELAVNFPTVYSTELRDPSLVGDDDPRLRWALGGARDIRMAPKDVLFGLLSLEAGDEAELLAFAKKHGPFLGASIAAPDPAAAEDAWMDFVGGRPNREQPRLMRVTSSVVEFISGDSDGVPISQIREALASLQASARMCGVLSDERGADWALPGQHLAARIADDEDLIQREIDRLWGVLMVKLARQKPLGDIAPVLLAQPRATGSVAYAELGILQLLMANADLRQCQSCSRLFLRSTAHHKKFCGEECYRLEDNRRTRKR